MRVYEMASVLIIIALLSAIGVGAMLVTKKHDGPIEEYAEEQIENTIEGALGLPGDSLDDKIDLSITSPEK